MLCWSATFWNPTLYSCSMKGWLQGVSRREQSCLVNCIIITKMSKNCLEELQHFFNLGLFYKLQFTCKKEKKTSGKKLLIFCNLNVTDSRFYIINNHSLTFYVLLFLLIQIEAKCKLKTHANRIALLCIFNALVQYEKMVKHVYTCSMIYKIF